MKYTLYQLKAAGFFNRLMYLAARLVNAKKNRAFLIAHPGLIMPPDRDLYETFQLDYEFFLEDGKLAAAEIIEWISAHLPPGDQRVLDWGCGMGRIIRHFPERMPHAALYGCDLDEHRIEWDRKHLPGITFNVLHPVLPGMYAPGFFTMVFGISVLTHIPAAQQDAWLAELHRILVTNGILLVSTQGLHYRDKLLSFQQKKFYDEGIFTQQYPKAGHRLVSTYHTETFFRQLAAPYFSVLAFFDGKDHPAKMGGQDIWILKKKHRGDILEKG